MGSISVRGTKCTRVEALLPASKSISNRALVLSALAARSQGEAMVLPRNLSDCDDTQVMVRSLSSLSPGPSPVACARTSSEGRGNVADNQNIPTVDVMAAGTAMRFLTAYFSVTPGERVLTGTARMLQRPVGVLVDALRTLGADIEYCAAEGFPPLRIRGRDLAGGEVSLAGGVSSQYISALMMIGPVLERGLRLHLTGDIISRPYIDLTMRMMRDFGAQVGWESGRVISVGAGGYRSTPYYIENDWSAASYWYEMAALSPDPAFEVHIRGVFADSAQGDRLVKELFVPLGVVTRFVGDGVVLAKAHGECPSQIELDLLPSPDLAQTMVVTCCMKGVRFRFTGLQSLRIKETDRIAALEAELRKWGYVLHDANDSVLCWHGERSGEAQCTAIDTYDDHRMAMAFAPACLVRGELSINDAQVVSKSYPRFWEAMKEAGFEINAAD